MSDIIEKVARAIEAVVMERLNVGVTDSAAHHMARAAISALADNVTEEMVDAFQFGGPYPDDCEIPDDDILGKCIAASIRAVLHSQPEKKA